MGIASNIVRETFQLLFLHALSQRWGQNPRPWAVKGGCALRFFFGSPRYSVDLDIDVHEFSESALKSALEPATTSTDRVLKQRRIGSIESHTLAKAGQNVLRIKFTLKTTEGESVPTKIEFSRRTMPLLRFAVTKAPAPNVRESAALPAFLLPTYPRDAMVALKTAALTDRNRNAIRDIFDLALFLPCPPPAKEMAMLYIEPDTLPAAARWIQGKDNDYAEYLDKIEPYMGGEENLNEASWNELRMNVAAALTDWTEKYHGPES